MLLNDNQQEKLDQLIAELNNNQISWLSGYFAALSTRDNIAVPQIAKAKYVEKVTIIYATDTGNSKKIASDLAKKLKELDIKVKLKAIEQYRNSDLIKEDNLILVTSTHGEGEPPETALEFYNYLHDENLDLSNLQIAILGLGDSNYKFFNQTAKDFSKRFTELGAKSLSNLREFDLDFNNHINDWYADITKSLEIQSEETKTNHYQGEIIKNIVLNDTGSNKETRHIEIEAEGVEYEPGDAIGIKIGDNSPRLYSISSSPDLHEGEIHLTVAKVSYIDDTGVEKEGLCSGYLAHLEEGEKIEFYVSKNYQFKLPDPDKDLIMVGPGTGVAPFRSFLAQRDSDGAKGKNWLFFGEQHARSDFLYQTEWQEYVATGLLNRIDLAFSRDGDNKIYVQHRIKERAVELKKWLEEGAYFYICGDKENMARDVEQTLIEILGEEYVETLKEEGRYLKDVY